MKIGIAIPFHLQGIKINKAYALTFKHYSALDHLVHYCGSEGELSLTFAEPFGIYKEVPQGPLCVSSAGDDVLREKFNDSLKTLPKDLDWYCLAGANDIINYEFFDQLKKVDSSGIKMSGVAMDQKLFCVDLMNSGSITSWKLNYQIQLELLPGINCFTRDAMQATNWRPYQRKGCETGAELLIKELGSIVPLPGSVLMIKGRHDLNTMQKIRLRHRQMRLSPNDISYIRKKLA